MDLCKKASIAAAVIVPVLGLAGMYVADADTGPSDVIAITGEGDYPTSGCGVSPSVDFQGTVTFVPPSDDANLNIGAVDFEGASNTCATAASDSGAGTINGAIAGNLSYSRILSEVELTGTVVLNGEAHAFTGQCEIAAPDQESATVCHAVLNS